MSSSLESLKTRLAEGATHVKSVEAGTSSRWCGVEVRRRGYQFRCRPRPLTMNNMFCISSPFKKKMAAVVEWYRYRTVACLVTSSSPVPLKTRRVGQRCTLNLPRAETSSRWRGVVVRRGGASSDVVHVT
ncbi:uncharacterized protein TNCV_4052941 [Trichonephila clavipes]|nr:uncharacterized protein TNCV_4052941 [Trichonephila clavipes]